jgi:TonB-linked SusC/RagA family outer membrane protein
MNFKLLRTLKGVILLSLFFCASSYAQVKKITGKITDSSDGGPIPGANVSIKGKPSNVSTNAEGVYVIQADPATDVLVFSFIGYKRETLKIDGRLTINVSLASENNTLDEVVFVGYGTKKKSELLGSVATIKAEDIQDLPVPNIAAALRNRIPGVGVNTVSGKPGSSITLNIRNASISDQAKLNGVTNEPLYVIDGITVTRDDFDNIDPTMVEDISFLKDASAAIYGAAGAKGVVLVTTKKGRKGKPQISYTGFRGVNDKASTVDMLSAYEHARLLNDGYRAANASSSFFFSDADLEELKNSKIKGWFDELWQASAVNRHNINVSGGSDAITFFAGGNYYDESGNYGGINYSKYGFRSGMTARIMEGLTAQVTLNADFSKKTSDTYKNGGENDQAFFQQLITTPKWVPIEIDGKPVNFNNNNNNPLAVMRAGNNIYDKNQGLALNASLEYKAKFLPGLTARAQFGKNNRNGNSNQYIPPYTVYNFVGRGQNKALFTNEVLSTTTASGLGNSQLAPSSGTNSSYQAIVSLAYDKTIGKHSFNVMVAGDQSEGSTEELSVYWTNQILPNIDEYWAFDQSSFTFKSRTINETVKRSYISRFGYDFDKKYFVEGIARYDASSNFAPQNRWGLFPSLGLGWVVSEENFFKDNIKFVNRLKLKANYGLVGEDRVSARLWQSRYRADANGYLYGETMTSGFNPEILPNPDISWEKARILNIGLDAAMLNNKINLAVEFYHRYSYDIFDKGNNENFPMYAGFEAPLLNYQQRTNWGTEISIGYRTKIGSNWGFNSDIMFGFANNRIDRMFYNEFQLWDTTYPDLKYQFGTDTKKYNTANYGLISKGMLRTQADVDALLAKYPNYTINKKVPQVGWLYYEDTNGDGAITEKDQVPMFNTTNSFGVGFNVGISYKTLSLNTNFVTRFGGKEFYDSKSKAPAKISVNVPAYWKDHWTPETPDAKFPRYDDASIEAGWNSDFWAVSGTMIRINSMTLTYKMPKDFLSKIGLADSRLVLTGNNLWTIINPLKYKDPYSSTIYDYPTLRTISLGLNVSL